MAKSSLFFLLMIAIFCTVHAQTVPHPAPAKKAVHKKTVVTKTVIINEDEDDESNGFYEEEMDEEGMQANGDYIVIVDEGDDENGYTEDDAPGDDINETGTVIRKTVHHSTAGHKTGHVYSSKYPKKLYYYNPKTGYYYKRRVPLKS